MTDIESIKKAWQFVQDNDGAITLLVLPVLSGLWWIGRKNWKRFRRRRLRVADVDTFPFEIIPPKSDDVVQRIYGSTQQKKDNPLADFNIPYQRRIASRDIQQELMQLVQSGWVAVLGPAGYGKTREVAELAKAHSDSGWTVLRLKEPKLLRGTTELPVDRIGRQSKLLFLLDDFNRDLFVGSKLAAVDAEGKKAGTIESPLQTRLLDALLDYTNIYGGDKVRVVMTARNERSLQPNETKSQWEKLEVEKREFADFWQRFAQYELLPPEDEAAAKMAIATALQANVPLKKSDSVQIARTNNRTFRNLVVNLEQAKKNGEALTVENFEPTMKGTWELRYRNALKPDAVTGKLIYDAVDLLRQSGVVLHPLTAMIGVKLLSRANNWQWFWQRRRVSQALKRLVQSERILEPRDGQIEAKGSSLEVDSYLLPLSQSMPSSLPLNGLLFSWWGIALTADRREVYDAALHALDELVARPTEPALNALVRFLQGNVLHKKDCHQKAVIAYDAAIAIKPDLHEAFSNKGVALAALGRTEDAIAAYDAAIAIKPDLHEAFYNKGVALKALGRPEDAIDAYDAAIAIKPDYHEAFYNKGVALAALGRPEEAIDAFDAAIAIKPDYHEAFSNKGVALAALGRPEEAIDAFDAAIAIKPDLHEAFYNKACLYALLLQLDGALDYLQKAIALDGTNKYIEMAKTDTDFDAIRDRPQF